MGKSDGEEIIDMRELEKLIEELLSWGTIHRKDTAANVVLLEKQLVHLYFLYTSLPDVFDQKHYPGPPGFPTSYSEMIQKNFPGFGYYNVCLNTRGTIGEYENGIGDAMDDITDILKDLWKIDWYFKYTSPENAVFYFKILFQPHIKDHIIGLLTYISDTDFPYGA